MVKDYVIKIILIFFQTQNVYYTSSPLGIISTRVFEALGSGAIGMFAYDSKIDVILKMVFIF